MKKMNVQKVFALLCVAVMTLMAASALARTVEPQRNPLPEELGGKTFYATVQAYDGALQSFHAIICEADTYAQEEISSLQVGDTLVVCDAEHVISEIGQNEDGFMELRFEDGEEILMDIQQDGALMAKNAENDMYCMHVVEERDLKAAENIILTDYSDLDAEQETILEGLDAILALQAQKEENGMGFDATYTRINLNEAAEISEIIIFYAPWQ